MQTLRKKNIRIALIGCGNIANFHVKNLLSYITSIKFILRFNNL